VGLGPLLWPRKARLLTTSGLGPAGCQSWAKSEKSHFSKVDFAIFWGANPPSDFDGDHPITPTGQASVGQDFKIGHSTSRFPEISSSLFVVPFFRKIFPNFFGGPPLPLAPGVETPCGQSVGVPFAPKTGRLRRPALALDRPKVFP
jgi:hypothetical protein